MEEVIPITFNWQIVIIVIIALVFLDKIITAINILQVEKNFPKADKFSIEKNPIAKQFFKQYGLWGGTVLYFFLSIVTTLIALWLLSLTLGIWFTNNKSIALYGIMIWYGFVIFNNLYFLLKFSKVVP